MKRLRLSEANAKTCRLRPYPQLAQWFTDNRKVYSLDLPAGITCPGAHLCHSWVFEENGKFHIRDGKHTQFRCYAATNESMYKQTREIRRNNLEAIRACKSTKDILLLLERSMMSDCGILRIHVSGDFFSLPYLVAMYRLAFKRSDILFYTYTKSIRLLHTLPAVNPSQGILLPNFMVTASLGGKWDSEIGDWRTIKVVLSEDEASGLPLDHTDIHAATPGPSFAILIHNTQPTGSLAAKAWHKIKQNGGGYHK